MDGVEFVKSLIIPNPRERLSADSALKASWLFPKETGMALYGKELAAGVTYGQESLVEVADEALNENGDKKTSLPQTSEEEALRLQRLQNATSNSPDGKLVVPASSDRTVRLRGSATGAIRGTLKGHDAANSRHVHSGHWRQQNGHPLMGSTSEVRKHWRKAVKRPLDRQRKSSRLSRPRKSSTAEITEQK